MMYNFLSEKYRNKLVKDTAKMWNVETLKKIMEDKV